MQGKGMNNSPIDKQCKRRGKKKNIIEIYDRSRQERIRVLGVAPVNKTGNIMRTACHIWRNSTDCHVVCTW